MILWFWQTGGSGGDESEVFVFFESFDRETVAAFVLTGISVSLSQRRKAC